MKRAASFSLLALAGLLLFCAHYPMADTTDVVSAKCSSPNQIPQNSSFWSHLGSLLAQLVENTPFTEPKYYFKTRMGGGDAPAFGEARCNASSSAVQCQDCLRKLSDSIWGVCSNALGARVDYADCGIHYESYSF